MKLYRSIDEKELEDIKKNNRIRFENPFWNFESEGNIVDIFRDLDELYEELCKKVDLKNSEVLLDLIINWKNKKVIKEKIYKWKEDYLKSDEKIRLSLSSVNLNCNIFTDLSLIMFLFLLIIVNLFQEKTRRLKSEAKKM